MAAVLAPAALWSGPGLAAGVTAAYTVGACAVPASAVAGLAPDRDARDADAIDGAGLDAAALDNGLIRAEFHHRGLASLRESAAGPAIGLEQDETVVFVGDDLIESELLEPTVEESTATRRVYRLQSGRWTVRVEYELQPGWSFLSKRVSVAGSGDRAFRVRRFDLLRGRLAMPPTDELRLRETSFLRFGGRDAARPHGLFVTLQNPFGQWMRREGRVTLGYSPDLVWKPGADACVSDRLCLGPYTPSGVTLPARMTPEWRWVPPGTPESGQRIDVAEVDGVVECARAFLLHRPERADRVMIGWTVNDYQVDIATPEGRVEYARIIDQAAAVGARHLLFSPANGVEAPLSENRDAWGWENLLWFTMGQKLRKGEWDPARDPLPASVEELVDHARAKGLRFLAYVYPSLPFLQQEEWTSWVPNGRPGGYLGADTGQRSFQDWLLGKLVDFHERTGAGGFSFDHWWIAYEETPSSRYAQWDGCRRILSELRRRIPDVVLDGRQQYHHFGVWTWLAGTYPHPLVSDEQPESFPAFPDLHWSRVSADRQRRSAWYFRQECFTPVEILPGYMTHQTPRLTEKGECPRHRFRPADWDLLGWKFSVISSIATAPFNHVINFLPARDEREFRAFSPADRGWLRDWLDWTDRNLEILRHVKPILGAPQVGRVDGTAAFHGGRGFIFLFNPNYRALPADLRLDRSIGLATGGRFTLRQLYPDAERGRLLAPPGKAFWDHGDAVRLPLAGTEALVLEVSPAPVGVERPLLLGAVGSAALDGESLELTGVRGEIGTERGLAVLLPEGRRAASVTANGVDVEFRQDGPLVSLEARFAGTPFSARQQIGAHDPSFAGGSYSAKAAIPGWVFEQIEERKRAWPVEYTERERAAVWLNSDRLLVFINVAEPSDETMEGVALEVNGREVTVKPAYTSIVRSNPRHTFVGWYADLSSLQPDREYTFDLHLPRLSPGQFQGLFLDTVEAGYTTEIRPGGQPPSRP